MNDIVSFYSGQVLHSQLDNDLRMICPHILLRKDTFILLKRGGLPAVIVPNIIIWKCPLSSQAGLLERKGPLLLTMHYLKP
jgi:uncharacterized protein (DUF2342 family)